MEFRSLGVLSVRFFGLVVRFRAVGFGSPGGGVAGFVA